MRPKGLCRAGAMPLTALLLMTSLVPACFAAGGGAGTYRDWRRVPTWAEPALGWAVQTGLLQGRNGNLLAPDDRMNRAEGAVCSRRLQFLSV